MFLRSRGNKQHVGIDFLAVKPRQVLDFKELQAADRRSLSFKSQVRFVICYESWNGHKAEGRQSYVCELRWLVQSLLLPQVCLNAQNSEYCVPRHLLEGMQNPKSMNLSPLPLCGTKHIYITQFCVWEIRDALGLLENFHLACSDILRPCSKKSRTIYFQGLAAVWQNTVGSHLFLPISLLDLTIHLTAGYYKYNEDHLGMWAQSLRQFY